MKLAVPTSLFVDGPNTVTFKFIEDHDRSSGFRVLAFNVITGSGERLIAKGNFVQTDPALWTAPRPGASDIDEGERLWREAALRKSPTTGASNAKCADCHSVTG